MRIPSGSTDRYIYFVAVDSTDLKTRETGLSSFTVYRSRNGAAAAAMSTPTVNETDSSNMPGVYELLLDEDTTLAAGNDSEEMVFHITATGMAPVTRVVEIYRPETTEGRTLGIESDGDLTKVDTLDGHTPQTGDSYARLGAPAGASVSADIAAVVADTNELQTDWANGGRLDNILDGRASQASVDTIDSIVDSILVDTDSTIPATLTTIAGYIDTEVASIKTVTDKLDDTLEDDAGTYRFTTNALEQAPSGGGGGGDATAANQTTIINHLTDIKGTGWATTDTLEAIRDRGDAAWVTATGFSTHSATDVIFELDNNSTQIAAIVADTSELQQDWTNGGRLDVILDAILVDTATTIPGQITGLNDISAGDVNAQVLDVLNVDTLVAGQTIAEALRRLGAITSGQISGAGTGTETVRDYANSANTIVVTVDGSGNRTGIVYN